jgi:dienelactone hydrolase
MEAKSFFKNFLIFSALMGIFTVANSAKPDGSIKEETVTYNLDGVTFKGVIAYDSNLKGKRPAVIVVPEWWGLNDYTRMRARMLAELGYVAMAADMFGEGRVAANPSEAMSFTKPFYQDPALAKTRLDAALTEVRKFSHTDPSKVAAIGYCFGGSVVLNSAKLGADLKGVVSFHGGLKGVPARKDLLKASILVCHGEADKSVSMDDYHALKQSLDSIGAENTFRSYPGATHAFTNPASTSNGKKFGMPIEYNEKADKESWNEMKQFLTRIFSK